MKTIKLYTREQVERCVNAALTNAYWQNYEMGSIDTRDDVVSDTLENLDKLEEIEHVTEVRV